MHIEGIITIIMQELEVSEKEAIFGHHSILGHLDWIDLAPRDTESHIGLLLHVHISRTVITSEKDYFLIIFDVWMAE